MSPDGKKENLSILDEESEDDDFGDDGVDDETLLKALNETTTAQPFPAAEELDFFWDELDTSTQIARDISSNETSRSESKTTSQARSFTSNDFDLTAEDIEELHSTPSFQEKHEEDKKLMPPPLLPAKHTNFDTSFTLSELERYVDDDLQLTQAGPE